MSHRILVACGTGAATSTHVSTVLKERLASLGLTVTTTQCRVQDVEASLGGIDVVVTTSALNAHLGVPVFNGVPFLTGIGAGALVDQIATVLRSKESAD